MKKLENVMLSSKKVKSHCYKGSPGIDMWSIRRPVLSQPTDEGIKALGLVVPVDSQEVDGHASQHDGQASATHHGLRVEGEDEQEGPEQEVNDWPDQADLKERRKRGEVQYTQSGLQLLQKTGFS